MSFFKSFVVASAAAATPVAAITAAPGDAPVKGPLPITAGVERLEKDGDSPFSELSMDDGAWGDEV